MKVLHVSLGLPPLRTGGLTRYCTEIMDAQAAAGDEVSLVFPGRFGRGKTQVRRGSWHDVTTYEVVNPLPVALTYGVAEPDAFCVPCGDSDAYRRLLDAAQPDVIHVHSFQGIHREFFGAAREAGVPCIFTTHDYYPMCPRCTLITSWGEICGTGPSPETCAVCNLNSGMTLKRSRVMQSGLYARMKESALVRKVGSAAKRDMTSAAPEGDAGRPAPSAGDVTAYGCLLEYNRSVIGLMALVLANSSMTMAEYRRFFPDARYELLPITHAGLERDVRPLPAREPGAPLRIGYYGGRKAYKGFDTLLEAARILDSEGYLFELRLYGDDYGELPVYAHATNLGRYAPEAVRGTLREHDVVVVPSKYHETFGFVVLEALCAGVPVICSDVVGAKVLVDEECVFHVGDAGSLAQAVIVFGKSGDRVAMVPDDYPLEMDEQAKLLAEVYRGIYSGVAP
jgi:glycosyltransferase involved in cell wall biosynthesis